MRSWNIYGVRVASEVSSVPEDGMLSAAAVDAAATAGREDAEAALPEDRDHAPYVRQLVAETATALERLRTRRDAADAAHSGAQWTAYTEYTTAKSEERDRPDPLGTAIRKAVAGGALAAALAGSYVGLHRVENPARLLLAVGFAAVFTLGAHTRLGIGRYSSRKGIRARPGDIATALAISCSVALGVAAQPEFTWTPTSWATPAAITGTLLLCWFVIGLVARSYPPVAMEFATRRRRRAESTYLEIVELRRGEWRAHTAQGRALLERGPLLMHVYYAANLKARRNSLTPAAIQASASDLPAIAAPAWLGEAEPTFDPCGLAVCDPPREGSERD